MHLLLVSSQQEHTLLMMETLAGRMSLCTPAKVSGTMARKATASRHMCTTQANYLLYHLPTHRPLTRTAGMRHRYVLLRSQHSHQAKNFMNTCL